MVTASAAPAMPPIETVAFLLIPALELCPLLILKRLDRCQAAALHLLGRQAGEGAFTLGHLAFTLHSPQYFPLRFGSGTYSRCRRASQRFCTVTSIAEAQWSGSYPASISIRRTGD